MYSSKMAVLEYLPEKWGQSKKKKKYLHTDCHLAVRLVLMDFTIHLICTFVNCVQAFNIIKRIIIWMKFHISLLEWKLWKIVSKITRANVKTHYTFREALGIILDIYEAQNRSLGMTCTAVQMCFAWGLVHLPRPHAHKRPVKYVSANYLQASPHST